MRPRARLLASRRSTEPLEGFVGRRAGGSGLSRNSAGSARHLAQTSEEPEIFFLDLTLAWPIFYHLVN
jgi:hypothetical protein